MDGENPYYIKELPNDPSLKVNLNPSLQKWITARDEKIKPGKDCATEDAFWIGEAKTSDFERCENNFISNYPGIYQRIQARNDHALGYNYPYAISYLNTASNGKASWIRLNKQPGDVIYKSEQFPNGADMASVLDFDTGHDGNRGWRASLIIIFEFYLYSALIGYLLFYLNKIFYFNTRSFR